MKYNKLKPFVWLILLPLAVTGQEIPISLTWGKSVIYPNANLDALQITGYDKEGIYLLRYNRETFQVFIDHFNSDLKLVKTNDQLRIVGKDGKRRPISFLINLNNKLYIISTNSDKSTKKRKVFAQEIDKETLALGEERLLAEMTDRGLQLNYKLSQDQSKILIYCAHKGTNKTFHKMDLVMFDLDLNVLWQKEVTFPSPNTLLTTSTILVSNTGNVCLLAATTPSDATKQLSSSNYVFQLFWFTPTMETQRVLELPDKLVTDAQIAILSDESVIALGFYTDKVKPQEEGTYFIRMNMPGFEITSTTVKALGSDMVLKRSKHSRYNLDRVILHDSGEITWAAEFIDNMSERPLDIAFDRLCGEILVFHLNADGDELWYKVIEKNQTAIYENQRHSSYAMATFENNLIFIFNEFLFRDPLSRLSASAHVCMIDKNGHMIRKKWINEKDYIAIMRPTIQFQLNDSTIIIFAVSNAIHQLAKITWND